MRRLPWVAVIALCAATASAAPKPKASGDDDSATVTDDDSTGAGTANSGKAAPPVAHDDTSSDDQAKPPSPQDDDLKKQDLTGHDLGTKKTTNEFERDRFFIDKTDTPDTEDATLIQGSFTATAFAYSESARGGSNGDGTYSDTPGLPSTSGASNFDRLFADLRLQTDFRHIHGGRWDARLDARIRAVDQPTPNTGTEPGTAATTTETIQSGVTGQNEYDLRELYIVRNGDRSDVYLGRQFIADLAGLKIDGVRVDYAFSKKFTLIGFAGLLPLRGSRSITTDYMKLDYIEPDGTKESAGRFVGTTGAGAAYRTPSAYGSFGGVIEAPVHDETPRIFGTANGYWRVTNELDLYHYAVIDLVGDQADASNFTQISAGANWKPDPRLRVTASFNRVDNETLGVQAGSYFYGADNQTSTSVVANEVYLQRLSTTEARASASAALGPLQRFEVTAGATWKYRPTVSLPVIGPTPTIITLGAEEGADVFASFTDRRSVLDTRLGFDFVRSFAVGDIAFQHTELTGLRASAAHDIAGGRGEWEAEIAYTSTKSSSVGEQCDPTHLDTCWGATNGTLLSVGGTVYYRLARNLLGIASAYVTNESLTRSVAAGVTTDDPSIVGVTGFLRASYRF